MKNFLLSLFLICTLATFGQSKKDTKVIVTISDTADIFNRAARLLYENGYSLTQKDAQLRFMETEWRQLKNTAGKVKTRVLFTDSTITFSSKYKLAFQSFYGDAETDIYHRGMNGSDMKIYWDELERLAKLFGTEIAYSK